MVVGEEDKADFRFRAIAKRLAEEIPDAELVAMPGVTHLPALQASRGSRRVVRRFLGR